MALNIDEELRRIAVALGDRDVPYALCGGLAVALHGFPRATQDIDILVREEDADRIVSILRELGYNLSAGTIPFRAWKETESRILRVSKADGEDLLTVDLVLVSSILEDVWEGRETYPVGEYDLSVVSLDGLRKMKRLAGRPQDKVDLERLEREE
ncbi:nucleotidyltransferase family protein [Candidatus Sumerlaeota bacterium]|nr:nucleotidyltransferase family protein [Candidatus Sumerlaeota bacterium]